MKGFRNRTLSESPWSHDENVPVRICSQDAKYIPPCSFCDIFDVKCPMSVWSPPPPGTDECTFYVILVLYKSPQFWLEMSVEWHYNFNAPWCFKVPKDSPNLHDNMNKSESVIKNVILSMSFSLVFQSFIFQFFHSGSCFSWDSYPRIPHLKSNSMLAELPSNLVKSGKSRCNNTIFIMRSGRSW